MSMPAHEPPGDPIRRWNELTTTALSTPDGTARIEDARRHADHAVARVGGAANPAHPLLDSDGTWHRIATLWFQVLTDTHAFASLAHTPVPRCHADPAAIRAWLASPSTLPGFTHLTVAESWDWDTTLTRHSPDLHVHVDTLIGQARLARMFGVAGHTIRLWHLADNDGLPDTDMITVTLPSDITIASDPLPAAHLIGSGSQGVHAAVDALVHVAHIVDDLLTDVLRTPPLHARIDTVVSDVDLVPPDELRAGRAFPALDVSVSTPAVQPALPATPTPTSPSRRR